MKKLILAYTFLMFTLTFNFFLTTSCTNDKGQANKNTSPQIITTDLGKNLVVTNIACDSLDLYSYFYDENDSLTCFCVMDSDKYMISYNPFLMRYEGEDEININSAYSFTFNDDGFATSIVGHQPYDGFDEAEERSSCLYDFDYDNEGYLKHTLGEVLCLASSGNIMDNYVVSLNFVDGNLINLEVETKQDIAGNSVTTHKQYTFEYSDQENKYQQPLMAFDTLFAPGGYQFMGFIGKGPKNLPSSCVLVITNEDKPSEEITFTYSYILNEDGTINTENINSNVYTYTYKSIN